LEFSADVLALKYAQAFYGVDRVAARRLRRAGVAEHTFQPRVGKHALLGSKDAIGAGYVLFIGMLPLTALEYADLRDFARRVLAVLAHENADAGHVALTVHGPGFGLDESEAFTQEVGGLLQGLAGGEYPTGLTEITFVEQNAARAQRFAEVLESLLPTGQALASAPWARSGSLDRVSLDEERPAFERPRQSESKPHVFVAMPFADAFDDLFYFGIQGAVHEAGYLCERIDLAVFVGDIVERLKNRIETAEMVVALLTSANANVYLEVGYAWGKGVPTVLLVSDSKELMFDVKSQRCLVYKNIRDLKDRLTVELQGLKAH
jgi:hypothetical protein